MEHNTNRIYAMMENLNVSMKDLAKDMHMTTKDLTKTIDNGLPNIEADEIIDRVLCLHIEKNRKLVCEDAELHEELTDYLMEQASGELRYRLGWFFDNMVVDEMERLEIESRQVAEKAESICNNLARLQRVYYQGKKVNEDGTV